MYDSLVKQIKKDFSNERIFPPKEYVSPGSTERVLDPFDRNAML